MPLTEAAEALRCRARTLRGSVSAPYVINSPILAMCNRTPPIPRASAGASGARTRILRVVVAFPCVASAIRVPRQRPVPENVLSP